VHKTLAWIGSALLIVGVCFWFVLPLIVRQQIHKRYPEVSFGPLNVRWGQIVLRSVTINKGWLVAFADCATIDIRTETVRLENGNLEADLDQKPPSTGVKGEHPNVVLENFSLSVKSKVRGLSATSSVFRVDATALEMGNLRVRYKQYEAWLSNVKAPRDFSQVTIARAEFPEGLSSYDGRYVVHPILDNVTVFFADRNAMIEHASCVLPLQKQLVKLTADTTRVHFEGEHLSVDIAKFGVGHPWLAPVGVSLHFPHVHFDVGSTPMQEPFDVTLARARIHLDPVTWQAHGEEDCQTWVEALPPELLAGPLGQVKLTGRLNFSLGVQPKPFLEVGGQCTSTCDDVKEPRHQFQYITYDADGKQNAERRTTGPDIRDDWASFQQINEGMPLAVMNFEDLGFRQHHGFTSSALEQSFEADIDSGKFQRGGSTITMQTAKNLWLSREKTFGRKVSELFLSQVLESCFTKNEIMELYLNIVEFGPNVYGLRQAAKHYFGVDASMLDSTEAFYLAWILPRPRKAPPPNKATMARIGGLMRMLASKDRIPDSMMLDVEVPDTAGWEVAP
jgi:hypothetical protein